MSFVTSKNPSEDLVLGVGTRTVEQKITQIGFPGWKEQVHAGAVRSLRDKAGLTHQNGIDSQVFFRELDTLESFVPEYHHCLQRLADK
jgi:hypothetical protein